MMYGLPENLTREDIRREYTIVNMRFKDLQGKMESRHRDDASMYLRFVRDDLLKQPNPQDVLPEHTIFSLMFAEGIISRYRCETQGDVKVAIELSRQLNKRHIELVRSGSVDRKAGSYLSIASNALDDFDPQHPETRTYAIDKAMFNLGEAEKLILEAEQQKPAEVGV